MFLARELAKQQLPKRRRNSWFVRGGILIVIALVYAFITLIPQ
jgi:hypothetical protein